MSEKEQNLIYCNIKEYLGSIMTGTKFLRLKMFPYIPNISFTADDEHFVDYQ